MTRLVTAFVVLILGTGAASASATRNHPTVPLAPGDHAVYLTVGGLRRDYILHIPRTYRARGPLPLVLYFHGAGLTAAGAASPLQHNGRPNQTLSSEADRRGFLVAYMDATRWPGKGKNGGTLTQWNGGSCDGGTTAPCGGRRYLGGPPYQAGVDDVAYTNAVLADVERRVKVERHRVYAVGHSSGAIMVSRLACQDASRFAAIAPMEGAIEVDPCHPAKPVSVLMFQALHDHTVAYAGNGRFPPAMYTLQVWRGAMGCSSLTTRSAAPTYTTIEAPRCPAHASVEMYTIDAGGHNWPFADPPVLNWQVAIWNFFSDHHR